MQLRRGPSVNVRDLHQYFWRAVEIFLPTVTEDMRLGDVWVIGSEVLHSWCELLGWTNPPENMFFFFYIVTVMDAV